jgi:hypothetical protein
MGNRAGRGLRAFPERTDRRLREVAVEEHHRAGRHDDAMRLVWAEFCERPFLEMGQYLAKRGGSARSPGSGRESLVSKRQRAAAMPSYWLRSFSTKATLRRGCADYL